MSLLTRCPACTTLYKVVPDQLRISQGWVKCGQCGEIFDASQHLMEASTEPVELVVDSSSESAPVPTAELNAVDQQVSDNDLQSQSAQAEPQSPDRSAVVIEPGTASSSESTTESWCEPHAGCDPLSTVSPTADLSHEVDRITDQNEVRFENAASVTPALNLAGMESEDSAPLAEINSLPDLEQEREQSAKSGLAPGQEARATESRAPSPQASFMHDAEKTSVRYHALTRLALLGLVGLLTLALGAQWVYLDHDRLAAAQPKWKPALETICLPLRCSVKPWQQIESIAIDAAAFRKLGSDSYRLSFTLKNEANVMLAWPSIELTLTDMQDHVVVRRVLSPSEMSAASDRLEAREEWPAAVNLRIASEPLAAPFAGYRLLAFYP
jgi:predicted Zn finger-like uncharacterized protein